MRFAWIWTTKDLREQITTVLVRSSSLDMCRYRFRSRQLGLAKVDGIRTGQIGGAQGRVGYLFQCLDERQAERSLSQTDLIALKLEVESGNNT